MLDILEHIMALQVMEHKHSSVVATTFIPRVASKRLYVHGSLVGYFFFFTKEWYKNDFVNAAYLIFVLTIKAHLYKDLHTQLKQKLRKLQHLK